MLLIVGLTLVIVLEVLSSVTEVTTSQLPVVPFCFGDDCYIMPEHFRRSWNDAQQMCRKYNSTLPIVDSPDRQRSFLAALYNFNLNDTENVWLGAYSSDSGVANWRWLDGSRFFGSVVQDTGAYNKSYAILSKQSSEVLAYAAFARDSYSYICEYNTTTTDYCARRIGLAFFQGSQCFVKYEAKLSWFKARSNCLANNGDLASFNDISVLSEIVDIAGNWVGLRHSQWNWQNAVTGLSSEVAFTSWGIAEPNDFAPSCILMYKVYFPNWIDIDCYYISLYMCQVLNATSSTSGTSATISLNPSASGGTFGRCGNTIAVGVGIGIPCAAVIVALTATIIVQQRKLKTIVGKSNQGKENIARRRETSPSSSTSALPEDEIDEDTRYEHLANSNTIAV